jgi:hypothetical protein
LGKNVGKLKQIAIAADGTKWGVTDANKVYRLESNGIADVDRIVSDEMLKRRWPNGIIPIRIDPDFGNTATAPAVPAEFIAEARAAFFGSTTIPGCTAAVPCLGWDAANAVRFIDCEAEGGCSQYQHTVYLLGQYAHGSPPQIKAPQTKGKRGYRALLTEELKPDKTNRDGVLTTCTFPSGLQCRARACNLDDPNERCVFDIWFRDYNSDIFMYNGVHEPGHMLGFMHEQGRPDRDQFIDASGCPPVDEEKYAAKFFIGTYDVQSAMHYTTSPGGSKCFQPLPGSPIVTFRNNDLPSPKDIAKLQLLYGVRGDWLTNTDWCAADVQKIHVGDFNGDGRQDLLCHSTDSGRVWIDYAHISGRFSGTDVSEDSQYCVGTSKQVLVGD